MKRTRLHDLKARLAERGWYPRSLIGRYTVYLGTIDLVIWLVRRGLKLTNPKSDFAGGWIDFLTFIRMICGLILLFQWTRRTLMWRLLNRLIVTYVFIGVVPIILLGAIF